MSPRQALMSAIHLVVFLIFLVGALFFLSFDYYPQIQDRVMEKSMLIGFGLLVTSLILLCSFYLVDRGRYLVIRMGVATKARTVRQTLEECIAKNFAHKMTLFDVEIDKKSQVEIKVSIKALDEIAREKLFIRAEKEFTTLLKERFGYIKPFHLVVKI